jgi:hypothetical protein
MKIKRVFCIATLVALVALTAACASVASIAVTTTKINEATTSPTSNTETATTVTFTPPIGNVDDAQQAAADFIRNGATYKFDGTGDIVFIHSDPGWTSSFMSWSFTFAFETLHPGYGDRSGQALAQMMTKHNAVVLVELSNNRVRSAICDNQYDMLNERMVATYVSGLVVSAMSSGNSNTQTLTYKIEKTDRSIIYVSYTSPEKGTTLPFTLNYYANSPAAGDFMEAYGVYNQNTNTINVAQPGDYIKTSVYKVTVSGYIVSDGYTASADGPLDALRNFVYTLIRDDGTFVNVSYTAYPPSPAADANKIEMSLYDGDIKIGDYMKAIGTYDKQTNTVMLGDGDFLKTYPFNLG